MTAHQIFNRAPIGSLLKGANLKGGSNTTIRDDGYLAMVKQCPCVKCGLDSQIGIEAAHVRMQSGAFNKHGGIGKKPSDCWCFAMRAVIFNAQAEREAVNQFRGIGKMKK